jgi:hypothetical protein
VRATHLGAVRLCGETQPRLLRDRRSRIHGSKFRSLWSRLVFAWRSNHRMHNVPPPILRSRCSILCMRTMSTRLVHKHGGKYQLRDMCCRLIFTSRKCHMPTVLAGRLRVSSGGFSLHAMPSWHLRQNGRKDHMRSVPSGTVPAKNWGLLSLDVDRMV